MSNSSTSLTNSPIIGLTTTKGIGDTTTNHSALSLPSLAVEETRNNIFPNNGVQNPSQQKRITGDGLTSEMRNINITAEEMYNLLLIASKTVTSNSTDDTNSRPPKVLLNVLQDFILFNEVGQNQISHWDYDNSYVHIYVILLYF